MWAHVLNAALGIWLMAAPAVLGYDDPAQTNDQIAGPIAATFAIVAWWEATRSARWPNLPIGLWLVAAPWVLGYPETSAIVNSTLVGLAMGALSLVRGRIKKSYGGGWRAAFRSTEQSASGTRSS